METMVTVAVSLVKLQDASPLTAPSLVPLPAERRQLESLSPKRFFDFITDPSLLITVLHSLEVAYWTFPFGFLLKPVINFFRVPNRRSLETPGAVFPVVPSSVASSVTNVHQPHVRASRSLRDQVDLYRGRLLSSLAKYDSLNDKE